MSLPNRYNTQMKGATTKVGIIGAGHVGSACLLALVMRGPACETVVIDRDHERAEGVVTDLQYGATSATPNIELPTHTELTQLRGDPAHGLTGVSWCNNVAGIKQERPLRNVFMFIDAYPATRWLRACNGTLDPHGFVLTGGAAKSTTIGEPPAAFETSVPGVFAVDDVRCGSVKRPGSAIGEGGVVVTQIHQHLAMADSYAVAVPATDATAPESAGTKSHQRNRT